jgi:hypothetical protein
MRTAPSSVMCHCSSTIKAARIAERHPRSASRAFWQDWQIRRCFSIISSVSGERPWRAYFSNWSRAGWFTRLSEVYQGFETKIPVILRNRAWIPGKSRASLPSPKREKTYRIYPSEFASMTQNRRHHQTAIRKATAATANTVPNTTRRPPFVSSESSSVTEVDESNLRAARR